MSDDPVMTWQGKVGVGATSPVTKQIEVLSCGLVARESIVRNAGATGTRTEYAAGSTDGVTQVGGPITFEARADVLAAILKHALGGTPSGTSYPLAEDLLPSVWNVHEGNKIVEYSGVYINRLTLRSSAGQPLMVTVDLIGKTYDDAASFPSISGTLSTQEPFMHHGLAVLINSVAHKTDMAQIVIDNRLQPIMRNSKTATHIKSGGRMISVAAQFGTSTDEQVLWSLATAGVAGSFTWTQGALSLALAFPKLQVPKETNPLQNRAAEVNRTFQFTARGTAPGDEVAVTLDSTP